MSDRPDKPYRVLARKYRPETFADLVGQDAMVRTLTNAFAACRIAQAFIMTGIRGTGKTTTARIIAKGLNCIGPDGTGGPTTTPCGVCVHCVAIMEGRHVDVMEMDAASRTGVNDIREIIESVHYRAANARFKVYIIDEVHMLSNNAFNALLKTLEEPPAHVKFIFATTEIRKVPVTILSRCQRFDLRRVEPEDIIRNLQMILEAEGVRVDAEGLTLIARAAEGSVRDAQSLLDQAIVQAEPGQTVPAALIRDMLGLADRAGTLDLFELVLKGDPGGAVSAFRHLYALGADPAQVILDLMEHVHGASVARAVGPQALTLPKDQAARLAAAGAAVSAPILARLWQMLLRAHEEVGRAPDPAAATDMALIRLAHAADLPGPEEALKLLRNGEIPGGGSVPGGGGAGGAGQGGAARALSPQASPQASPQLEARQAPTLQTFEDLVARIDAERDIALKLDVERFVRPVSFRPGVLEFEPAPGAPANLAQRLVGRLKAWTGQPWLVAAQGGGGAESLWERQTREARETRAEIAQDPFVLSVIEAFPGAEVVQIRHLPPPEPALVDDLAEEAGED
jgi:DNA polymerase-3 subunit gamma/tau